MKSTRCKSVFKATLHHPADSDGTWAFAVVPREASQKLPRRERTTVDGTINGCPFQATLEPDGQLGHWLKVDNTLLRAAGSTFGDVVDIEMVAADQEAEPEVPQEFRQALLESPEAQSVWNDTTTVARIDWIHWITSAKQAKTRAHRIISACEMLASGKRRVCCFDPSGFYSKAFGLPKKED